MHLTARDKEKVNITAQHLGIIRSALINFNNYEVLIKGYTLMGIYFVVSKRRILDDFNLDRE